MQSKSLLIAIAAFAVTATGVQAYGGAEILGRAGLTEEQVSAIEAARELRSSGNLLGARNKLIEAGIDENALHAIRDAAREARSKMREALANDDYGAFRESIIDSPLADIVTSKDDFEQFREAHELKLAGEWEEANEMLDDLGIEPSHGHHVVHRPHSDFLNELTEEQREALQVARQANDRATIQAIFDEAGLEQQPHRNW